MNTTVPFAAVELIVKQVNLDGLHEIGRSAMQAAFGGFIAKDPEGHDGATLLHELLAYYEPMEPGWVGIFDLSIPEHRDLLLSGQASVPEDQLRLFDLDGPAMVIAFLPLNERPHPFAARYTDKAAPFFVTIPIMTKRIRVDRVVDLRSPNTASWFTGQMTRWSANLDGEEVDLIPAKRPLHKFQDLIPTLLEQSHGGGSRALATSAGLRLRQLGANSLIFPSARTDSVLRPDRGRVVESRCAFGSQGKRSHTV